MTIRKTASLTPQRGLVLAALTVSLTGCGMISSVVGTDQVDYKSAKKASTLDVPPDLTQLQKDNRYSLPDSNRGVATASGYNAARGTGPAAVQAAPANEVATTGSDRPPTQIDAATRWSQSASSESQVAFGSVA